MKRIARITHTNTQQMQQHLSKSTQHTYMAEREGGEGDQEIK